MAMDIKSLNALRRRLKEVWEAPGDQPKPLIHLSDEDGDRDSVLAAFKMISSEMGLRFLRFDFGNGFTEDHRAQLARSVPRIVVMTRLEGVPADMRPRLEDEVRRGSRTLPVCVCFGPADEVERVQGAWRRLRELEAQEQQRKDLRARYRAEQDAKAPMKEAV